MGTAIQIILAIVVIGIMWATGFLPQLLMVGGGAIGIGLICGVAWWIFGSKFATGWTVGLWVTVGGSALTNLWMIIANEGVEIEVFENGRTEEHSDRAKGIVGLLATIALALIIIFWD